MKNNTNCTCTVCGLKLPKRFIINSSYGHVCLGCAKQLYDFIEKHPRKISLIYNHSWHRGPVAYFMAQEIHDTYEQVKLNTLLQGKYVELINTALYIILDIENGVPQTSYIEIINDYLKCVNINRKELIALINSMLRNRIEYIPLQI